MKILVSIVAVLAIIGCADLDTSDTTYSTTTTSTSVGENATYTVINSDGEVSVEYAGTEVPVDENGNETVTVGEFPGEDAPKEECNAAGYFWCSIQKQCTRTPLDDNGGGSCN